MLDDSSPQGALTYVAPETFHANSQSLTIWADQTRPNHDTIPVTQKWGFVFDVPDHQGVLKSVDFTLASAGGNTGAKSFKIALYEFIPASRRSAAPSIRATPSPFC